MAIKKHANVIENRLDDSYCTVETLLRDNIYTYKMCLKYNLNYLLIDKSYDVDLKI